MGVSESTWSHKRNELLQNFSLYYEYEVEYEGRSRTYHIIRQLGDYQKPPNKRDAAKRDAVYRENIIEVIKKDNVQTAVNVARIIQNNDDIVAFNHKFGTIQEYTRLNMVEMFGGRKSSSGSMGMIMDKIWCRLDGEHNCYVSMSDEMVKIFLGYFHAEREHEAEFELELMNDVEIGLISREEANAIISERVYFSYANARREFKAKYGYTPIKVPVYGINGVHIMLFETQDLMEDPFFKE